MSFEYGPVEFVLVGFDEDRPSGGVLDAIKNLIELGSIRLLDLVFVSRSTTGELTAIEIDDVSDEYGIGEIELEASGIAADEDVLLLASALEPGASAAIAVIELTWARELASRLDAAGGYVIHTERIPAPVVNAALAAVS